MNIFDPKNNFDLRDYFKILERRKWYFIVPIVLALPIGITKIASHTPRYVSSVTLRVQPSSFKFLPASVRKALPNVSQPQTAAGFRRQINNEDYLHQMIDILHLDQEEQFRLKAEQFKDTFPDKSLDEIVRTFLITRLKKSLKVTTLGADLLQIKFIADTPEFAYAVVKTLTDIYIDDVHRLAMSNLQNALNFNDEKIQMFKQRLEEAERKLESFRRQMITNSLSVTTISREALSRINGESRTIDLTIKDKQDYLERLGTQFQGNEGAFDLNTRQIKRIMARIDKKIFEMAELMKSFSSAKPEVINVNRKINDSREDVRDELARQFRRKDPTIKTARLNLYLERALTYVDFDILTRKKRALGNLIESFKTEKARDPQREMMLTKLQRDVDVNRQIYNTFVKQNQGVEMEESIALEDASERLKIVEPARRSSNPVNAGSHMILFVTIVLGFGLGGGAVYVREYLDNSVRTANEAEVAFGVPVIGIVPNLGNQMPLRMEKSKNKVLVISIVLGVLVFIAGLIFLYFKFKVTS